MFKSNALKIAIAQLKQDHPDVEFGGMKEANTQVRERNQAKLKSKNVNVILNYKIITSKENSDEEWFFAIYRVDQNNNEAIELAFGIETYEEAEKLLKE